MPRQRTVAKKDIGGKLFTEHDFDEAAEMMTLGPDHPIWAGTQTDSPYFEDHFVRLQPPAGKTPQEVASVKRWLLDVSGASAVKVLPIPAEEVPEAPEVQSTAPQLGIRHVVMARAARTPGIRDQGELAHLLTVCMDKARI
ncbi:MAG: hypothetical protein KAJ19_18130 [Gammaproteobacteria bacterium]|nr:hypothetical protein [Gammaproteobacteria bacterium]